MRTSRVAYREYQSCSCDIAGCGGQVSLNYSASAERDQKLPEWLQDLSTIDKERINYIPLHYVLQS